MLRPSESLAVRLQMYVEVHAGATPDIGWGALHACIFNSIVWLDVVHAPRRRRKSLNKRELS